MAKMSRMINLISKCVYMNKMTWNEWSQECKVQNTDKIRWNGYFTKNWKRCVTIFIRYLKVEGAKMLVVLPLFKFLSIECL